MNKIKQIKAEIERLIEMNKTKNGFPAGTMCAVRIETYEKLLSFIATLAETSGDLEEEIDGLEEEIEKCLKQYQMIAVGKRDFTEIARHFANWQKEQMMKEAVEGEVIVPIYERNDVWSTEIKIPGRYGYGEKVRIIILPKED